jgi:hypothetical protein
MIQPRPLLSVQALAHPNATGEAQASQDVLVQALRQDVANFSCLARSSARGSHLCLPSRRSLAPKRKAIGSATKSNG